MGQSLTYNFFMRIHVGSLYVAWFFSWLVAYLIKCFPLGSLCWSFSHVLPSSSWLSRTFRYACTLFVNDVCCNPPSTRSFWRVKDSLPGKSRVSALFWSHRSKQAKCRFSMQVWGYAFSIKSLTGYHLSAGS